MLLDTHRRPLTSLRLSVTDRCNLRCAYCMPEAEYAWLPRGDLLSFEEIATLVDVFGGLGVDKLRLTGGEPLLRKELPELVRLLAARSFLRDLALTTNGLLLVPLAEALARAGLHRVTVSLDTLRPERFTALTRNDRLGDVLAGIDAARAAFPTPVKLDTVVLRGTNDDELEDLLAFAGERGLELRFIEYMDVGGATRWAPEKVVPREEILARVAARFGPVTPEAERGTAPAERFRLRDGTVFGVIASTTAPFCGSCDRSRLTADGMWLLCLYAREGLDLRGLLRSGTSGTGIAAAIEARWRGRTDRGAEERLALSLRVPLHGPEELRRDPRLEMHTRGG